MTPFIACKLCRIETTPSQPCMACPPQEAHRARTLVEALQEGSTYPPLSQLADEEARVFIPWKHTVDWS